MKTNEQQTVGSAFELIAKTYRSMNTITDTLGIKFAKLQTHEQKVEGELYLKCLDDNNVRIEFLNRLMKFRLFELIVMSIAIFQGHNHTEILQNVFRVYFAFFVITQLLNWFSNSNRKYYIQKLKELCGCSM